MVKRLAPQVRIYAILARKEPTAVIFRRGPSDQVLLVGWNTAKDSFEVGQWFKGRIYERRCDLSPDGSMLLYFAAKYRDPLRSWSAISRPPFLTALALWPKGDGWGGGGHFIGPRRIALNHRDGEMKSTNEYSIPKWLKVEPFGKSSGWGEDDPVWAERLRRDGWRMVNYPKGIDRDFDAKVVWKFSSPIVWQKQNPKWPRKCSLKMSILGIREKDGPWYMTEHTVIHHDKSEDSLGRSDWADWDRSGDLLFAKNGCLYRLECERGTLKSPDNAKQVADFSGMKFEPREAPRSALRWT